MNKSDDIKCRAIAHLAKVANSDGPDALQSAATALHVLLTRAQPMQEHDFLAASETLADAVAELAGLFATHLDFLGVLHGKDAQLSQHRRRNVGAALREKSARLGRPLTADDFPSGHPVPIFALAYWGGVAAWAAGSPDRAQHPNGYWADRDRQIAAIRLVAARHPDTPLTHELLHAAGLHRLGLMLGAEKLQTLADEAGVDRKLHYQPRGWWTADRVISVYAETCQRAGVTLSTTALTAIGGEACSLKSYAAAHFVTFRAFQRAVVARHPDIKVPDCPTAADGTELDSWSEVPVYNALRLALPEISIDVHVILEGEGRRSGDFVIGGCVWVEVLGIAVDAMPYPTSARQAEYAANWKIKAAIYAKLGIDPVLIEPDDIQDTARLAARVAEIAVRLQLNPIPPLPPSGRCIRAKGSWNFEMLCQTIAEVAGRNGTIPTFEALQSAGFGHACSLLRQQGMRQRVASTLGLSDPNCKGVWTCERVISELAAWVRRHSCYPTKTELQQAGHGALASAGSRLWAGAGDSLREAVATASGVAIGRRRAPDGSVTNIEQAAAALTPLATQLGRMPLGREATAAGLGTAWALATRHGGVGQMAARIGVPCDPHRRRSQAEMLAALTSVVVPPGARLTTTLVRAQLGFCGLAWVRRCGGIAAVRAALAGTTGSESPTG